jgi:ammonia channel protein AmtB
MIKIRCNFRAYCLFSLLNTVVYCVPARWIWGPTGFLAEFGVIDIAGSGAVHLLGGVSGEQLNIPFLVPNKEDLNCNHRC